MNTKKWIALSLAACTLTCGIAVFAEENTPASAEDKIIEVPSNNPDIMLINEPASADDMIIEVPSGDENIMLISEEEAPQVINGGMVENVIAKNGLYPVREIAEGLGYTVNWDGEARRVEIIRGAQYITMNIDVDAYTFARRAPESLGTAPVIIEDRTYVPARFVEEYLGADIYEGVEGAYDIMQPAVVTVKGFEEDGSILVEDEARGNVIVHISGETKILIGGEAAEASAIEEGMTISVTYGKAMTFSLPPQTTALKIVG